MVDANPDEPRIFAEPYRKIENLADLLARMSDASPETVQAKGHLAYFKRLLKILNVRTMVVERSYVDRDYLSDYSAYYVRCFHPYRRNCARIHFFRSDFKMEEMLDYASRPNAQFAPNFSDEAYAGFLVIKPLPETIIGRTCLEVPHESGQDDYFPTTRTYESHLLGHEFRVESLALQEQDRVVSACATSALWSAFHRTGWLFHHPIPTPVEITRAAYANALTTSRLFPHQNGLELEQIAEAIRSVSLDPVVIPYHDDAFRTQSFRTHAYAYLRTGTPLLMPLYLVRNDKSEVLTHAVTLSGYRLGEKPSAPKGVEIRLRAHRMSRLFAHDDQVGPFAPMDFTGGRPLTAEHEAGGRRIKVSGEALTTLFGGGNHYKAIPNSLIVPLHSEIGIPYLTAERLAAQIDTVCRHMIGNDGPAWEWDVYLTSSPAWKAEVRESAPPGPWRQRVLTMSLPRFIWAATAWAGSERRMDFLLDATDVEQGRVLLDATVHRPDERRTLARVFALGGPEGLRGLSGGRAMIERLAAP